MQPKSPAILYNKNNNNSNSKKQVLYTQYVIHAMVVIFCRQYFLRLGLITPFRHYRFLVSLPFFFPFFLSFGNSNFVNFSSSVMIESI